MRPSLTRAEYQVSAHPTTSPTTASAPIPIASHITRDVSRFTMPSSMRYLNITGGATVMAAFRVVMSRSRPMLDRYGRV